MTEQHKIAISAFTSTVDETWKSGWYGTEETDKDEMSQHAVVQGELSMMNKWDVTKTAASFLEEAKRTFMCCVHII